MPAVQATFEDIGIPLAEVTFACVDLETTGGAPPASRITEIGAVKYRGGERLGAFHTLVDPGVPIPRFITYLTGIDDVAVRDAPPMEAALPPLVEFLRGAVFVAHNAGFDFRFLNHDLRRLGYEPLEGPPVCTARLARRVLAEDVPNVRLQTLAQFFRTAATPTHRALDDAEACAEVLHGLLEVGGRLGILTLEDLRQACRARGSPHYAKIRMSDGLPRTPGVYAFRRPPTPSGPGEVLYVGKARDIRARVRSYFYGDDRRKIHALLAEMGDVEAFPCATEVEALVLEARLIRTHQPRYNRRGKAWRRYAYLKLDLDEAWPRLKVVRRASGRGAYLGPFPSAARARLAKEALEDVVPIRRCTASMGRSTRFPPCALADVGRCAAPCDGRVTPERYEELVRFLHAALSSPGGLLEALEDRMRRLAQGERFEEAASVRDRLDALVGALSRARAERWLVAAGRLVVEAAGRRLAFRSGALERRGDETGFGTPIPLEAADEVRAAAGWLARTPVRLVEAERAPAEPVDGGAALARLRRRLQASRR
ncbi:MAG TPA: DEDD exonuclease domain-containing protein [Actinomycetota bacterium]|nr:DEDD exonuclease domain-containing protein [Actinomycetota bacterium]